MLDYYNELQKANNKNKQNVIEKVTRQDTYCAVFSTFISSIIALDNFPTNYKIMQNINIIDGMSGIIKENDKYYMCKVMPIGLYRNDGRPNKVNAFYMTESGVNSKECINDVDIILWYNNSFTIPDIHIIEWLAHTLTEVDVSMLAKVKFSRYNPLVRVKNQIEKMQIEEGLKGSKDGEIGIYISDKTLESLTETPDTNPVLNITDVKNSDKLQYLTHFNLDLMNRFYSLYGAPMNTTGKMAQQTEKEISGKDTSAWALPLDMLTQAKEFCERFNNLFNENVNAHFGILHELAWGKYANDCTKDNEPNKDIHDNINKVEEEKI